MDRRSGVSNEHISKAVRGTRYLTFRLADERYGVEIVKVKDITCYSAIVRLGTMPPILKGFVSLAGTMLPVIDLRERSAGHSTGDGFNIVIAVHSRDRVVGIVVDAISDVLEIATVHGPAAPDIAGAVDARYLSGVGTANDEAVRLVDIDRLIDTVDTLARVPT